MRLLLATLLALSLAADSTHRKPIFVHMYLSNGERAGNFINWGDHPEFTFMSDAYPDGVQEMQLTKKGTLNMARLGAEFASDYVDQREFFDIDYRQDEFIIRALDTNSCFMSAYSFIVGMYPDTTEGIIPDPRIDGRITEVVAGTEDEVNKTRLEFLDLPAV